MKKSLFILLMILVCVRWSYAQPGAEHDLAMHQLPTRWDEGIPLGNGILGALIWDNGGRLRFSLDRADLWDLRPMKGLHRPEFSYEWVARQVAQGQYRTVQEYFDEPYDKEPAPSKIPGAALEFDIKEWGGVRDVRLHLRNALCEVEWNNGEKMTSFVQATEPAGWIRFEHVRAELLIPSLIPPRYQGAVKVSGDPVGGDDLSRLGYEQGIVRREDSSIVYEQKGWGGFSYEVSIRWRRIDPHTLEAIWSISSRMGGTLQGSAASTTKKMLPGGWMKAQQPHDKWWSEFWSKSSIHIPEPLLEKQWWLEQYKFGSVARKDGPIISLQAVWTADNGRLPPWKGDIHHDLNTQLSYWPCYSGNHLEEGLSYLNNLEKNKSNFYRYTKAYFGIDGLAVPGVTTLDGTEMGGWIQYSLSPTVSSWLSQHFYLQWRYSMDREFLRLHAYPWFKETASFLEKITQKGADGKRKLPISSSPEINNNDISAWFSQNTNYDLAMMRFTFSTAATLAEELGLQQEALHWKQVLSEFGEWWLSPHQELQVAPSLAYKESHRHFSHMMAIHPLGLIRWEDGEPSRTIIRNSIHLLDSIGPAYWCGYSYAWLASMKARAKDGAGAAEALRIFVKAFCSTNSFHLNGDQTKSGYSTFDYRPFTLEGNFAFAAGVQEMLLQSYPGFIEIMPAVPEQWRDISFDHLRAEGAFLVSARKSDGIVREVTIVAEKGGICRLQLPFSTWELGDRQGVEAVAEEGGMLRLRFRPGGEVLIKNTNK